MGPEVDSNGYYRVVIADRYIDPRGTAPQPPFIPFLKSVPFLPLFAPFIPRIRNPPLFDFIPHLEGLEEAMESLARSDLNLPNPSAPPPQLFSSTELDAAEQLVQLSSSASLAASSSSCSSTSSWPRPVCAEALLLEAEDEDEEEIVLWRRTKRYRTLADLYAATRPVAGRKRSRR